MSDARSSTATATTGTAEPTYRGRFAPSPTGQLHLGSLIAALGSYLDARQHQGRWLVRIEDLDPPRVVPGEAARMLATLETLGLRPDEPVLCQSTRNHAYEQALQRLSAMGLVYPCGCSRRDHAATGYPGTCRSGPKGPGPYALRMRLPVEPIHYADRIQGPQRVDPGSIGDPILRRRDGLFAYQLAVVVDDGYQGITDVVRGADLLSSTGWQICIQRALGLPSVGYAHLPVLVESDGSKLAKSRRSVPLPTDRPQGTLRAGLRILGLTPPDALDGASVGGLLDWATSQWSTARLAGLMQFFLPQRDLEL